MADNGWKEMFLDAARDGRISTSLVSKRQKSGRLAPVFASPSREKEEAYIKKMLARDEEDYMPW